MTFKRDLQALCDRHNVKLIPGLSAIGDDAVQAVLYAYKLGDDGKAQQTMKIGSIIPGAAREMFS